MKYHFEVLKEDDGSLWAQCIEIKGCTTQSEDGTMENLYKNMEEVLNLCLDEPETNDIEIPLPDTSLDGENVVEVSAAPAIAFSVMVRYYRKQHGFSQKEMMRRMGMKNVFSYQRLEKRTDPKLSTIVKIKRIFPEMPVENIF